eukprot:COSAG04_NODE_9831_length_828_cov_3.146776_2_plen_75_part_01
MRSEAAPASVYSKLVVKHGDGSTGVGLRRVEKRSSTPRRERRGAASAGMEAAKQPAPTATPRLRAGAAATASAAA